MHLVIGKAKQILSAVQAADPQAPAEPDAGWTEKIVTALAVSLAVLVVAVVAVLMGMD